MDFHTTNPDLMPDADEIARYYAEQEVAIGMNEALPFSEEPDFEPFCPTHYVEVGSGRVHRQPVQIVGQAEDLRGRPAVWVEDARGFESRRLCLTMHLHPLKEVA